MAEKLGNGGYSLEDYSQNDGKYIADGEPNNDGSLSQADKKVLSDGLELDEDDIFSDEELLATEAKALLETMGLENNDSNLYSNNDIKNDDYNEFDKEYERHDGETYKIPEEKIQKLQEQGWFQGYEIKEINVKEFVENKKLNDPNNGMFGRRKEIWGDPENYHYDEAKNDEGPIRITKKGNIIDGNHRLYALYNDGYDKAEVLVTNGSTLHDFFDLKRGG